MDQTAVSSQSPSESAGIRSAVDASPDVATSPLLQVHPRPAGYLMRHAQGRLPLWLSLWVNYVGLTLVLCLVSAGLKHWSFVAQAEHQPLWGLFLLLLAMCSFCALFLAVFWGAQGTLLAAHDYGRQTGRKTLVGCLYTGVILYAIVWIWGLAKVIL